MKKHYIYKIVCMPNNKVYIGQTNNIKRRLYEHKSTLRHNKHHNEYLQRAFNKYGENSFTFEFIEECNLTNVDDRERYWIKFYKSNDKNYGFNSDSGGHNNKTLSNEHKMKISAKVKGENNPMYGVSRKGSNNPFYGKKLSEEAKRVISEKAKKRYPKIKDILNSEESIIKRSISNTGKKRSEEFKTRMSEMAKERIGEKNPFYGKVHSEETKRKISIANSNNPNIGAHKRRKLIAINLSTNEEFKFNSIKEVTENIKELKNRDMISAVLNGRRNQYKGYTFKPLQ